MKRLFLLRHGEAGFSEGTDFQRQLTTKGKEKLNQLGKELQSRSLSIDFMFCSTAERTMQTAGIIQRYVAIKEEIFLKDIYESNLGGLIHILEGCPSHAESCLIIGHNPILSLLVSHVSGENYINMQPGMLACLDLEISDWSMVGVNTGSLIEILQ
ncbi:histidine phosphatase family protein [Algoriphagus lutimaris]|uniref:SixA phosphatase family protein n=1 Tax=Algoriphagus lutimaris TaxID=613197 RepID=UPI00196B689B|nr:histidine phosphatase family protein [Algoriphagus lutimaris]MBN3518859.1 histidine phosphatase family protein [Algoriphagus lutimaris]